MQTEIALACYHSHLGILVYIFRLFPWMITKLLLYFLFFLNILSNFSHIFSMLCFHSTLTTSKLRSFFKINIIWMEVLRASTLQSYHLSSSMLEYFYTIHSCEFNQPISCLLWSQNLVVFFLYHWTQNILTIWWYGILLQGTGPLFIPAT